MSQSLPKFAGCVPRDDLEDSKLEHSWRENPAENVNVRTEGYLNHKQKDASDFSIYSAVTLDTTNSPKKLANIAQYLKLRLGSLDPLLLDPKLFLPPILVINWMLPNYAPENPIWGKNPGDGDGFSICFCYELSKQSLVVLRENIDSPEALPKSFRLLRRFIDETRAPADRRDESMIGRLKAITRVVNADELKLWGLVKSYNGTPFLIKSTSTFAEGTIPVAVEEGADDAASVSSASVNDLQQFNRLAYFEIDIDVHRFSCVNLQ